MVLFEYRYQNTPIHNLNPITKIALTVTAFLCISCWMDPRYQLPLTVYALALNFIAKTPKSWYKVYYVMVPAIPFTVLTGFYQYNPELFKVYPHEFVSEILFKLPNIPILGTLTMTYGGAIWIFSSFWRGVMGFLVAFTFIYTTSMTEATDTLARVGAPTPIVFMVAATYKFIPHMLRVLSTIVSAQTLRGWQAKSKNPVKLLKTVIPLMNPLMRRTAQITEEVATATQIRAFGAGRLARSRVYKFAYKDYVISMACILTCIIVVIGLFVFKMGLL